MSTPKNGAIRPGGLSLGHAQRNRRKKCTDMCDEAMAADAAGGGSQWSHPSTLRPKARSRSSPHHDGDDRTADQRVLCLIDNRVVLDSV
jgi:hypothetical protein